MKPIRLLTLAAACAALAGCLKDTSHGTTTYILKPLQQNLSTDPNEPLTGVLTHAFDADTTHYTVASYDDALQGIATSKENPSQQLQAVASSTAFDREGTTGWVQMGLPLSERKMILAVDTEHRVYAYTEQELEKTLATLYVTLIFKNWKEGFSYQDGNWSFYNEFYTPPKRLDTSIRPLLQTAEAAAAESYGDLGNLKAYAYAVDTTAWRIASYDDAQLGRITSKSDDSFTRSEPSFQAYADTESGLFTMQVSVPTLMVVVVDRANRLYAYSQQTVDLEGASPTFEVLFRPWRNVWIDVQDGWRIVNEALDPAKNTTTTQNQTAAGQ